MHFPDSKIASYPEYIQESTGGGSYDEFPAINDTYGASFPNAPLRLGQIIISKHGNAYQYVRASGNLVAGDVVKMALNATGTVSAADATSDNIHSVVTNITGITSKNQEFGNQLFFPASALASVRRFIKGNSATTGGATRFDISVKDNRIGRGGYDADAPAAAIAAGSIVNLFRRYHVVAAGTIGDRPVGIARHAVTSGQLTLVGVHGVFLCRGDASGNAVTDNGPVVVAGSGTVGGPTGTMTTAELRGMVGIAKLALASGTGLIPVLVDLFARW